MEKKQPFLIVREFLNPLACEQIIEDLRVHNTYPIIGQDGSPRKSIFHNNLNTTRIMRMFDGVVTRLEENFNSTYLGTHQLMFEWYPTKYKKVEPVVDAYQYTKNDGWKRANRIDFTGILWLNDYNDGGEFDPYFEVYGGNLNFPNFDINFRPERGTLVLFPSTPNFVYNVGEISYGSLTQVHFQIRSTGDFQFKKEDYDLNPSNWD